MVNGKTLGSSILAAHLPFTIYHLLVLLVLPTAGQYRRLHKHSPRHSDQFRISDKDPCKTPGTRVSKARPAATVHAPGRPRQWPRHQKQKGPYWLRSTQPPADLPHMIARSRIQREIQSQRAVRQTSNNDRIRSGLAWQAERWRQPALSLARLGPLLSSARPDVFAHHSMRFPQAHKRGQTCRLSFPDSRALSA